MSEFLWGVYPYLCAALFFTVPVLRMVYRPFGWSTRASGIFGRRVLGVASVFMHWGLVLLVLGHLAGLVGGLLGLDGWITFFYWIGIAGGLAVLVGSGVALVRRLTNARVRAMSQHDDYLVHLFLLLLVGLGLYQTLGLRIFGNAYPTAAWFASLWQLSPQPELMASATPVIQIHVLVALTFLAYFPFTKLVHVWSYPVNYLVRPYQAMRTLERRFRGGWTFDLHSDRGVMVAGMLVLVALFAGAATFLGDAEPPEGRAATAGTELDAPADRLEAGFVDGGGEKRLAGYPLYLSQCARCHGVTGDGEGPGAGSPTFATRPRDLVTGHYRCVSTQNGVATRADLREAVARGLSGSGMPGFPSLDDRQLTSLVDVLEWMWEDRPEPGPVVDPPPRPETDAELVERGQELYGQLCAQCHGPEGRGDGLPSVEDRRGLAVPPADLAAGKLKCGDSGRELYRRVAVGVPGGPDGSRLMPAFGSLGPEDVWAVVAYVEELRRVGAGP